MQPRPMTASPHFSFAVARGSRTAPVPCAAVRCLVKSAGFPRIIRTGVTLQVAQVARIDLTLQARQVSETVEVVGAASLLDTQTSSRGLVIDQKKIVDLPLNGRDYNPLALLSPGVLTMQFRTELFNAFNHANVGPPNLARESNGFGQILTAGNARIVQCGLKFYF